MVDTPRTISFHLASQFQDGQAAGSIVPQRARDLVKTIEARTRGVYRVTDPEYGAVGDGASHPANTRYSTLASLQAVYGTTLGGVTVALTQELDWLAHQLAIKQATPSGGVVYSPTGRYWMTNSNSASDGSGTLVFPSAGSLGLTNSFSVSWKGDLGATFCVWANDLGTGKRAVLCDANRRNPNYAVSSPGYFEDLTLVGPTAIPAFGSVGAAMMGVGTADRRILNRINISNFWCGVEVVGGQTNWEEIYCQYCYYGLYYQDPRNQDNLGDSNTQFGDMTMVRVIAQSFGMAGIGCHHAGQVVGTKFINCFFGAGPYGIFKETNAGSPFTTSACHSVRFETTQFENIGNALISDDRADPASRMVSVYLFVLSECQFMWDWYDSQNFHLPNGTAYAIMELGTAAWVTIENPREPQQWIPGTDSMFHFNTTYGFRLHGDIDTFIGNCNGNAAPRSTNFAVGDFAWYNSAVTTIARWSGWFAWLQGNPSVNDVVIDDGNGNVQPCAGTATEAVRGILIFSPSNGNSNVTGLVAYQGPVDCHTTGTVTRGQLLRTAAGGACQTSGSGAVVGIAMDHKSAGVDAIWPRGLN